MRWNHARRTAGVATLVLLFGCGSAKHPLRVLAASPRDLDSAALGVSLSIRGSGEAFRNPPSTVVFALFVDAARDAAGLRRATLLESNFADGDRFYLLNAAPGVYAVVGALYTAKYRGAAPASEVQRRSSDSLQTRLNFEISQHTRHDEVWFAREAVAATLVEVGAAEFAFAGDIEITADQAGPADAAQSAIAAQRSAVAALRIDGPRVHRITWLGALASARTGEVDADLFRAASQPALSRAGWSALLQPGGQR
jgi:hypothetical protein